MAPEVLDNVRLVASVIVRLNNERVAGKRERLPFAMFVVVSLGSLVER